MTFHPASPYAISKVGTDLVGRYYGEAFNMKVMTTRMFTHTGPRRGDVFAPERRNFPVGRLAYL